MTFGLLCLGAAASMIMVCTVWEKEGRPGERQDTYRKLGSRAWRLLPRRGVTPVTPALAVAKKI